VGGIIERSSQRLRIVGMQERVDTCGNRADPGHPPASRVSYPAHVHSVGDDEPVELQLPPQKAP
jgi:hypothetical protein